MEIKNIHWIDITNELKELTTITYNEGSLAALESLIIMIGMGHTIDKAFLLRLTADLKKEIKAKKAAFERKVNYTP